VRSHTQDGNRSQRCKFTEVFACCDGGVISKEHSNFLDSTSSDLAQLPSPIEIINAMIDLRVQLLELEQQIQALQPAFFAACLALNTDKIALERAIITRRLTPGQRTYSPDIDEQTDLLKQLKQQFQQTHEPIAGREVTWAVKLLLSNV
jgi:hypothetical protein